MNVRWLLLSLAISFVAGHGAWVGHRAVAQFSPSSQAPAPQPARTAVADTTALASVRATALNPSILLSQHHQVPDTTAAVARAAALGCPRVNVVVSMFCELDQDDHVLGFGLIQKGQYTPLTPRLRAEFRNSLAEVFTTVRDHGLGLSVLVHLDAVGESAPWRNYVQFDPLRTYQGYSYKEAVIVPLLEACAASVPAPTRIDLALAGEMGRSVFAHAKSYTKILQTLRQDQRCPQLHMGMSFNFSNVAGGQQPSAAERRAVQELVEACDFIGLSNYRPCDVSPTPQDFAETVAEFLQEMRASGAALPTTMPLHFSEIGLGGGTENGPAKTPHEAAQTPWEGTIQPRDNPWSDPALRAFRVQFHQALLQFLARQPGGASGRDQQPPDGPVPGDSAVVGQQQKIAPAATPQPVTEAFLWSEGSWDPLDIVDQGFADPHIIQLIQQHNQRVRKP